MGVQKQKGCYYLRRKSLTHLKMSLHLVVRTYQFWRKKHKTQKHQNWKSKIFILFSVQLCVCMAEYRFRFGYRHETGYKSSIPSRSRC